MHIKQLATLEWKSGPARLYGEQWGFALPYKKMLTIRLKKTQWAKVWRAMIEVAPVRLIADDPLYEVLPAHLEVLTAGGFTYEVVPARARRTERRRHGTAD
jgi:hypothetical protein